MLAKQTLLHSLAVPNDWAIWLTAADVLDFDPGPGLRFESSSLAYQAAIEGMGIAIAQRCLVQEDLKAGRLVFPFDFSVKDGRAYFLVYPSATANETRLVEFREWIMRIVHVPPPTLAGENSEKDTRVCMIGYLFAATGNQPETSTNLPPRTCSIRAELAPM